MAELVKGLLAGRSIVAPALDRDSIEKLRVSTDYRSEALLPYKGTWYALQMVMCQGFRQVMLSACPGTSMLTTS